MTKRVAIIASAICLIALAAGVRWFTQARLVSAYSSCINGLRQIDGAKQQWALEHHATTNDLPTWSDLLNQGRYMRERPVCPKGGAYSIERIADPPKCSLGGPGHSLF